MQICYYMINIFFNKYLISRCVEAYLMLMLNIYSIMYDMWNIRMRASKIRNQGSDEMHISGAEGIYNEAEIPKIVKEYINRALTHSRGKPQKIILTLESIKQRQEKIPILPVITLQCHSPDEAEVIAYQVFLETGISKKAIKSAFKVLKSPKTMRGASLMGMKSGKRMELDKERGVRVSRLGIDKSTAIKTSRMLSKMGINNAIVKEALILASKAASSPDIVAEICISDDPDYTTGYIASKNLGYLRVPNIKRRSEKHGGRVFFVKENVNIERVVNYLEKRPVVVLSIISNRGGN